MTNTNASQYSPDEQRRRWSLIVDALLNDNGPTPEASAVPDERTSSRKPTAKQKGAV